MVSICYGIIVNGTKLKLFRDKSKSLNKVLSIEQAEENIRGQFDMRNTELHTVAMIIGAEIIVGVLIVTEGFGDTQVLC